MLFLPQDLRLLLLLGLGLGLVRHARVLGHRVGAVRREAKPGFEGLAPISKRAAATSELAGSERFF